MNERNTELAIKIFDYFFKKANIDTIMIPNSKLVDDSNIIYFRVRLMRHLMRHFIYFVTNDIVLNDNDAHEISRKYVDRKYLLKDFPRDIKARIVLACISSAQSLIIPFDRLFHTIVLIPKAKSLEELAIKMELEK